MSGDVIGKRFGPYALRAKLGAGGMGAVYAAEHELLGRRAAVKVLLPHFLSNPDMIKRFVNEARSAAATKHAGVVEIYDVAYGDGGVPYIAMELLEGQTLGQRMQQGEIERTSIFSIARQIASALEAAHRAGVVHRDLKPDNIFLVRDPEVVGPRIKLVDFGVAKVLQSSADANVTQTGVIVGTPTYMSPEQCRGVAIDHRADLYSLGCILFRLIAGQPPFRGEVTFDVISAHVSTPPPVLSTRARNVSPALDALVARLLAKAPTDRPGSAAELVDTFAQLEAPAAPPPRPASATKLPGLAPPRFHAAVTVPDVTLPTSRVVVPDDAPTKQTRGVAQLAAMVDRPPAAAPRPPAAPVPSSDDIEQMPSMLLQPDDLAELAAAARPPVVAAAAAPPPVGAAPPPPVAAASPPPVAAAAASWPPGATGPPPPVAAAPEVVRAAEVISPWPAAPPANASTMTLGSASFQTFTPPVAPRRRTWLVVAVAGTLAAAGIALLVDWRGSKRAADGVGVTGAADPHPADAAAIVVPPPSSPADAAEAVVAGALVDGGEPVDAAELADLDLIEMLDPDPTPSRERHASSRVDAGVRRLRTPADVLAADQRRADAKTARAMKDYVSELGLLRQAYQLDPQPRDLLALGDAARLAGKESAALKYYRALVDRLPTSREAATARARLEVRRPEAASPDASTP